jgi:hypothetical protein
VGDTTPIHFGCHYCKYTYRQSYNPSTETRGEVELVATECVEGCEAHGWEKVGTEGGLCVYEFVNCEDKGCCCVGHDFACGADWNAPEPNDGPPEDCYECCEGEDCCFSVGAEIELSYEFIKCKYGEAGDCTGVMEPAGSIGLRLANPITLVAGSSCIFEADITAASGLFERWTPEPGSLCDPDDWAASAFDVHFEIIRIPGGQWQLTVTAAQFGFPVFTDIVPFDGDCCEGSLSQDNCVGVAISERTRREISIQVSGNQCCYNTGTEECEGGEGGCDGECNPLP